MSEQEAAELAAQVEKRLGSGYTASPSTRWGEDEFWFVTVFVGYMGEVVAELYDREDWETWQNGYQHGREVLGRLVTRWPGYSAPHSGTTDAVPYAAIGDGGISDTASRHRVAALPASARSSPAPR